jgi:hypothetical protein
MDNAPQTVLPVIAKVDCDTTLEITIENPYFTFTKE